jgi:hypothetical protein
VIVGNGGNVMYEGGIFELATYLGSVGYNLTKEERINPVEYLMELVSNSSTNEDLIELWKSKGETSHENALSTDLLHDIESSQGGFKHDYRVSEASSHFSNSSPARGTLPFLSQCSILCQRHALYTILMLHGVKGMIMRNLVGGILFGVIYYRNADKLWDLRFLYDPTDLSLSVWCYNVTAICFSVPLFIILVNGPPIPSMFAMKRYCDKEQVHYYCYCEAVKLLLSHNDFYDYLG